MSMFNDISWRSKDNKKECESNAQLVSLYAKRFGAGQWSFLGLGSEKKWYSISEDSPQEMWDRIAEQMMIKFGIIFMSMFNDISCGPTVNEKIACQMPNSLVSLYAKRFGSCL